MTVNREWQTISVYFHHLDKYDHILTQCLIPVMDRLAGRVNPLPWYFNRGWQSGPHIRLHIQGLDAEMEQTIRQAAAGFISENSPPVRALGDSEESVHWLPNGTILRERYLNQDRYYGGPHASEISEQLFFHTSETVAELLRTSTGNFQSRSILAMDLMILAAASFGIAREELGEYFLSYALCWQDEQDLQEKDSRRIKEGFVRQSQFLVKRYASLLDMADTGEAQSVYAKWAQHVKEAYHGYKELKAQDLLICPDREPFTRGKQPDCLHWIAMSHIRLVNNCLGIRMNQEYTLGYWIYMTNREYRSRSLQLGNR